MNLKSFVSFVKKNYKLCIPIILILVMFIAFIIYYIISKTVIFESVEEKNVYQYFTEDKTEYNLKINKNRKGVITNIEPIDVNVVYDSTPIYIKNDDNIVIFPSKMSVVAPVMNCSEYLANNYSYINLTDKQYVLVTNGFNSALGHYFLYDGSDLYFFIEKVTMVVNGNDIELDPYSYVVAHNKKMYYYDRKEDKYISIDTKGYDNYIYNDYYRVYINGDYIDSGGEKVLLTSDLDTLMDIKEMKRITD